MPSSKVCITTMNAVDHLGGSTLVQSMGIEARWRVQLHKGTEGLPWQVSLTPGRVQEALKKLFGEMSVSSMTTLQIIAAFWRRVQGGGGILRPTTREIMERMSIEQRTFRVRSELQSHKSSSY